MASEVERAAAPALLTGLLADQASADALQKSLAMEDTGSQTQTQVSHKTLPVHDCSLDSCIAEPAPIAVMSCRVMPASTF